MCSFLFSFFFCILRTSVSLISLGENTSYPEKNLASSLVRSHPYTSPFSDTVMQPILQLTTCGWHDKQANLISSQRMKTSVSNDLIAVVRRFHRRSRCYAGHELWNSSYKGPYLALRPPCANFGICLTKGHLFRSSLLLLSFHPHATFVLFVLNHSNQRRILRTRLRVSR